MKRSSVSLLVFPAFVLFACLATPAQQQHGGGGGGSHGAAPAGGGHAAAPARPAAPPARGPAPFHGTPNAQPNRNFSDKPGHPNAPHVDTGSKWVRLRADTGKGDAHYHLDKPYEHGHFHRRLRPNAHLALAGRRTQPLLVQQFLL